ncbi:MAG: hypothetical protein ACRDNS_12465 [Trebonia sp.]
MTTGAGTAQLAVSAGAALGGTVEHPSTLILMLVAANLLASAADARLEPWALGDRLSDALRAGHCPGRPLAPLP